MNLVHKATWYEVDKFGQPRPKDRDVICLIDTEELGVLFDPVLFVKQRWVFNTGLQTSEVKLKVLRYLKLEELELELSLTKEQLAQARAQGQVPNEH